MREAVGDIWVFQQQGHWVCVTTNGILTYNKNQLTMGAGVAAQAAIRFPGLPYFLGRRVKESGNHVHAWDQERILSFPTKQHYSDPSPLWLIKRSAQELMAWLDEHPDVQTVCIPRPGVGHGKRDWETEVKPLLAPILDDRVVILVPTIKPKGS